MNPAEDERTRALVAESMAALERELEDRTVARYKLDLTLTADFSLSRHSPGFLTFWESGTRLNGEGDARVYLCPTATCEAVIPDASRALGMAVCPKCHEAWNEKELVGEIYANLWPQGWAARIAMSFRTLHMNADVRIIHPRQPIRSTTLENVEHVTGIDKIDLARETRRVRVRLLKDIMRDLSAGADMERCFLAFIKA